MAEQIPFKPGNERDENTGDSLMLVAHVRGNKNVDCHLAMMAYTKEEEKKGKNNEQKFIVWIKITFH